MSQTMGRIIKYLRKKNGFTQEELAEILGVTYQAVSKWENDTGMPDISQIVPLASIFKVSTDTLFGIADTTEEDEFQIDHACVNIFSMRGAVLVEAIRQGYLSFDKNIDKQMLGAYLII